MAEPRLKKLCGDLASARRSAVVAIVLPTEPLVHTHVLQLHAMLCKRNCERLSVVLHSGGGDINAAYQIVDVLTNHCQHMTTVVPLWAKSAATLFVLGSNDVVLSEIAQLGPLDTQVPEREKGGIKYASALNPFKTLEELQRFSLETLDVTVKLLLARAELSVDEAIGRAMDMVGRIAAPLFSQLTAEKVGEYSRALAIGEAYGERLMRRIPRWENQDEREKVLDKLIRGYPSHDYIIDYKELKELGFTVSLPTKDEEPIVQAMLEYLSKRPKQEIVVVEDGGSQATSTRTPGEGRE